MHSSISRKTLCTHGDLSPSHGASHSTHLAIAAVHITSYGEYLWILSSRTPRAALYVFLFPWAFSSGPLTGPIAQLGPTPLLGRTHSGCPVLAGLHEDSCPRTVSPTYRPAVGMPAALTLETSKAGISQTKALEGGGRGRRERKCPPAMAVEGEEAA